MMPTTHINVTRKIIKSFTFSSCQLMLTTNASPLELRDLKTNQDFLDEGLKQQCSTINGHVAFSDQCDPSCAIHLYMLKRLVQIDLQLERNRPVF